VAVKAAATEHWIDRSVRYAGFVTLGYLLLTLPLLARGEPSVGRAVAALAHGTAMLCLYWATRATTRRNVLADWLPLALVPLLYAELPYLMAPGASYHDAVVQRWEAALFGGQPARALAAAAPAPALSELLHLGYLSYYAIIYAPPLAFYFAGRRHAFGRAVLAAMACYAACFLAFALFPVQGPRYAWGAPPGVPDGPIRALALFVLERGSSRGTAFPSSHAAVAIAQTVVTLRYDRRLGVAVAAASLTLMIGAVYGGFHYAIDVLVGGAAGLVLSISVLAWRR
jgi:membrane-associated phospholipid phosphatase